MKKLLLALSVSALFFASCSKETPKDEVVVKEDINMTSGRVCESQENLARLLSENPGLAEKMNQIESFTKNAIETGRLLPDGTIEIPVVFNVLYKTTAENVSLAQLQSQIAVLNNDFGATNNDYNNTPSIFQSVRSGNTGIRFVLDAVNRKATTKTSWRTNDDMKKASRGGIDPTSPTTKLNFWVCNLANSILGYAQFPGGPAATDGIVCDNNATGNSGTVSAPYNGGRTATHEIGHWLNLRHIWGDATCGNDQVGDTPQHNASNGGCPAYPHYSTCSGTPVEMTMNYMDYTYDACMYMFTIGQKQRMQATFASGGPRNSFAQP
jgi:hypothetical protein